MLVHQREDAVTDFREINFHFDGVLPRVSGLPFVVLDLFLVLHAGDEAPGYTLTSNCVLVCDRSRFRSPTESSDGCSPIFCMTV